MSFTIIIETRAITRVKKTLPFIEIRKCAQWVPSNIRYDKQYVCDMSEEHIKHIISMFDKYSPSALGNSYFGLRNNDWLRLFKKELKYRKADKKVNTISDKLTAAIEALDRIRNY